MPAPQVPPGQAAAGAAAAGAGTGLVINQDGSQGGEGARVVPGAFQISERVPDRANHPARVRSGSQPGHCLIRQLRDPVYPWDRDGRHQRPPGSSRTRTRRGRGGGAGMIHLIGGWPAGRRELMRRGTACSTDGPAGDGRGHCPVSWDRASRRWCGTGWPPGAEADTGVLDQRPAGVWGGEPGFTAMFLRVVDQPWLVRRVAASPWGRCPLPRLRPGPGCQWARARVTTAGR
jgi:hypothetical protein